jgi:hypothetical protein
MNTKLKGDIAEQAAILQALKRGWGVLKPVGDRMPYDLVFDVNDALVKVQIKAAWYYEKVGNYVVDNRRTKTNRRTMMTRGLSAERFRVCPGLSGRSRSVLRVSDRCVYRLPQ